MLTLIKLLFPSVHFRLRLAPMCRGKKPSDLSVRRNHTLVNSTLSSTAICCYKNKFNQTEQKLPLRLVYVCKLKEQSSCEYFIYESLESIQRGRPKKGRERLWYKDKDKEKNVGQHLAQQNQSQKVDSMNPEGATKVTQPSANKNAATLPTDNQITSHFRQPPVRLNCDLERQLQWLNGECIVEAASATFEDTILYNDFYGAIYLGLIVYTFLTLIGLNWILVRRFPNSS